MLIYVPGTSRHHHTLTGVFTGPPQEMDKNICKILGYPIYIYIYIYMKAVSVRPASVGTKLLFAYIIGYISLVTTQNVLLSQIIG